MSYLAEFVGYILSGFVGAIIALWLEHFRYPSLELKADDSANDDVTYPHYHTKSGERWKYFRIAITNKKIRFPLSLVMHREAAQNCTAQITVTKIGYQSSAFAMNGRWASTPEIPFTGPLAQMKVIYPDPVTIPEGKSNEFLDVITQRDGESYAFGWNAESYLHDWRHPDRKLDPGKYKVEVVIQTQNGISFFQPFSLNVSKDLEKTNLSNS